MITFTFVLYLFIFIFTTYCAKMAQRKKYTRVVFVWQWLALSFLVHWLFCAWTNIGVDYNQYKYIIGYDCEIRFLNGHEVGFNGLSFFLYKFIKNTDICIFIYKTVALLLFYYGFYLLRNHAMLWLCILAYNVHTYFAGFYIIAMQISVSLIFVSAVLLLVYNKRLIPVLMSAIAATFHTSAIIMVVCFISVIIFNLRRKSMGWITFIFMAAILVIVLIEAKKLFAYTVSNYDALSVYEIYDENHSEGSGMFNYFLYAFFLIFVIPLVKSDMERHAINAILFFYGFSFLFSIMGYIFGIARLNYYNIIFLDVSMPYVFYQRCNMNLRIHSISDVKTERILWVLYLLFLGIGALQKASSPMSTSMLHEYTFFNPFY